jgi:hypothetical protein
MDAVDTLLRTITTGNGYAQTVAHFHRSRPMMMHQENDYPVLYYWFEGDRSAMVELSRQYKIVNLIVGGWIFAVDPEDAIEQLMADVEKVLLTDPSLNGTAIDINILDEDLEIIGTTADDADKRAMSYKTFAILYDHTYADPRAA